MIIIETTTIAINPNDNNEYQWWADNQEMLLSKKYELDTASTVEWYATHKQTSFIDLKEINK